MAVFRHRSLWHICASGDVRQFSVARPTSHSLTATYASPSSLLQDSGIIHPCTLRIILDFPSYWEDLAWHIISVICAQWTDWC